MNQQVGSLSKAHPAAARKMVLIIDDDASYCQKLAKYLRSQGLECEYVCDPHVALDRLKNQCFSVVTLDVRMSPISGFQVLTQIRSFSSVPILMITACRTEPDLVRGLNAGADDYVSKAASLRELLARVDALLRRGGHQACLADWTPADFQVDQLRISYREQCAYLADLPIELTQVEFWLLFSLARNAGTVLTRKQLTTALGAVGVSLSDGAINVHIYSLRQKLAHRAGSLRYIHTFRGAGYKFMPPPHA